MRGVIKNRAKVIVEILLQCHFNPNNFFILNKNKLDQFEQCLGF